MRRPRRIKNYDVRICRFCAVMGCTKSRKQKIVQPVAGQTTAGLE